MGSVLSLMMDQPMRNFHNHYPLKLHPKRSNAYRHGIWSGKMTVPEPHNKTPRLDRDEIKAVPTFRQSLKNRKSRLTQRGPVRRSSKDEEASGDKDDLVDIRCIEFPIGSKEKGKGKTGDVSANWSEEKTLYTLAAVTKPDHFLMELEKKGLVMSMGLN